MATAKARHKRPARSRAGLFVFDLPALLFVGLLFVGARFVGMLFVGMLFVGVLWPLAALAQVTATDDYLARMDADRDGRVALVEYQDWLSYAFDQMDRDRDGTLAAVELPGGRGKPVTRVAHRDRLAGAFRRQDANRDGFLDARELAAPPR
jgi:hypothetical protein